MTSEFFRVRDAVSDDVPRIASLEKTVFSDPWSTDSIGGLLGSEGYTLLCAEADGNMAGYAVFSHVLSEGELLRVAVSPEYRRRGIGKSLIKAFLESDDTPKTERLFLEVRSANEPALSLYGSLGFVTVGKRRAYYKNPTDDAVIMELSVVTPT